MKKIKGPQKTHIVASFYFISRKFLPCLKFTLVDIKML